MKAAEQSCACHHCDKLLTPATCLPLCTQATLSGVLTAGMFYFISNAKPLPQLSPVRPHPSIFCAYFFASLLGQFALQLGFLVVMYRWAICGCYFCVSTASCLLRGATWLVRLNS
jgi:hypothetical protein